MVGDATIKKKDRRLEDRKLAIVKPSNVVDNKKNNVSWPLLITRGAALASQRVLLCLSLSSHLGSSLDSMISILPRALQVLLGSTLWHANPPPSTPSTPRPLSFQLRHEHAVSDAGRNVFSNVPPSFALAVHTLSTAYQSVHRPSSFAAFSHARRNALSPVWHEDEIVAPNVTDRNTLLTLAKMTSNDYTTPSEKDWYQLDGWNRSYPFGWEPDNGKLVNRSLECASMIIIPQTGSEVTSSSPMITQPLFYPSKGPLRDGFQVARGRHPRRTRSTITFSSPAAVLE